MQKRIKSKALRLPFKPNKFQPLQHCDNIANYYADVLFALYTDVRKEWNQSYHCVADGTNYIRFTKQRKNDTDSPLKDIYEEMKYPVNIKEGTIIFAVYVNKKKNTIADYAKMFVYGDSKGWLIIRFKDYFTIEDDEPEYIDAKENSLKKIKKMEYSADGEKINNFRKTSLVKLMGEKSFEEGRKLGQRTITQSRRNASKINGMKVAVRHKAVITDNSITNEYEFKSSTECFNFFNSKDGQYRIFNNLMALRRAVDQNATFDILDSADNVTGKIIISRMK